VAVKDASNPLNAYISRASVDSERFWWRGSAVRGNLSFSTPFVAILQMWCNLRNFGGLHRFE